MKLSISILFLCISTIIQAQTIKEYFDFRWDHTSEHNASYYSLKTKTDSGWQENDYFIANNQIQMSGLYEDDSCTIKNGKFLFYYFNGQKSQEGIYNHNKKEGLFVSYHSNGRLADSITYNNGNCVGIGKRYFSDGQLQDSSFFNSEGEGYIISWFKNQKIDKILHFQNWDQLSGNAEFYHINGKLASKEEYQERKLINKIYFDENGKKMDTTNHDKIGSPIKGISHWQKYLDKTVATYVKEKNNYEMPIIVSFQVNIDGSISDVQITLPLRQSLDNVAIRAISDYPEKWIPTIENNRKIPFVFRQTIFIKQ